MPEAEPDPETIRFYFRIGLALLVPVAVVFTVYGMAAVDATALEAAKPCAVSTLSSASSCLSYFEGVVTKETPRYRAPTALTISVAGSTVDVGRTCIGQSIRACNATSFPAGTNVATEWWRGRIVRLGRSGAQPTVITEQNPERDAAIKAPFLIIAVLALIPLLLAGLLRQAPMSVNKLIDSLFSLSPEGSVPISRSLIFRVALGAWGWLGIAIWFALYMAYVIASLTGAPYSDAVPLVWLGTGLLSFAIAGIGAYLYLSHLVQNSKRQAVVVQKVRRLTGRFSGTKIWYGLPDGGSASTYLSGDNSNLGHKGLSVDALTDPRTGKVRRLLGKAQR